MFQVCLKKWHWYPIFNEIFAQTNAKNNTQKNASKNKSRCPWFVVHGNIFESLENGYLLLNTLDVRRLSFSVATFFLQTNVATVQLLSSGLLLLLPRSVLLLPLLQPSEGQPWTTVHLVTQHVLLFWCCNNNNNDDSKGDLDEGYHLHNLMLSIWWGNILKESVIDKWIKPWNHIDSPRL